MRHDKFGQSNATINLDQEDATLPNMDTNLHQRLPIYPVRPVASMAGPAPNITIKPRTMTTTAQGSRMQAPTLTKTSTPITTTSTAIAQRRAYVLVPIKNSTSASNNSARSVATSGDNQPTPTTVRPPAVQQPPVTTSLAVATITNNIADTRAIASATTGPSPAKRPRPALIRGPYKKRPKRNELRKHELRTVLPLPRLSASPEHRATSSDDESPPVELNRRQDNPNSNFTTSERTFVLMALAIARDRLDIKPNWENPREGFGTHLCQEVREILDERAFRHVVRKSANYVNGERKSPSDNVIRDIWTNFLKNGTPARVSRGGRRKNEEARVQIKELLESGKYSSREVAAMTGVSRALVCNAIKEFKGSARKAARANKAVAGADGASTSEDANAQGEQQQQPPPPPQPPKVTRGRGRPRKVKNLTTAPNTTTTTTIVTTTSHQISESVIHNPDYAVPQPHHQQHQEQQLQLMQEGDISHYTGYC